MVSMPKSVLGMRTNKSGFTLIEILVVVVILGITASVAMLAFGNFGEDERIEAEAERFAQKLKLVRHHAILEATPYAIEVSQKRYSIYTFSAPNLWQEVSSPRLKPHTFPQKISASLTLVSSSKGRRIVIQPSGEITPFILNFSPLGKPPVAAVKLIQDERIVVEKKRKA